MSQCCVASNDLAVVTKLKNQLSLSSLCAKKEIGLAHYAKSDGDDD